MCQIVGARPAIASRAMHPSPRSCRGAARCAPAWHPTSRLASPVCRRRGARRPVTLVTRQRPHHVSLCRARQARSNRQNALSFRPKQASFFLRVRSCERTVCEMEESRLDLARSAKHKCTSGSSPRTLEFKCEMQNASERFERTHHLNEYHSIPIDKAIKSCYSSL